jgi:hypothetical protein
MAITEEDEVSTVLAPPKATSCDMRHGNSSRRLLACSHGFRLLKKGFTDAQIHHSCDRDVVALALFRAIQYGNNKYCWPER